MICVNKYNSQFRETDISEQDKKKLHDEIMEKITKLES